MPYTPDRGRDPLADGVLNPMNAMRREHPAGLMDETIAHPSPLSSSSGAPESARGPGDRPSRGPQRYTFSSGARPLEGYTVKRAIGRGGFGEVYYATSDAGKEVALKLITRNIEIERRGVLHCMNLKSPHLITIYDLRTNDTGDTFVIMEYVSGPSLTSILAEHPGGLPPDQVRAWLKGLVAGVSYLHDHGIVHRDLKPANLFLEEGVVKIGDYGLSKSIAHSNDAGLSENVGTCYYMAPEISRGKYHKPIDIYAIGIILYEMLTGRVPFEGETAQEVLWKHLTDQPDLSKIIEPYRTALRRALAKDPNHRPPRAHDLLPAEDAPRPPDIRIIEKEGTSPPVNDKPAVPAPAQAGREDVLVIGEEEPPFYIGPDTVPPRQGRPRRSLHQRIWGVRPVSAASRPAPRPQPARRPQPAPAPPTPAPPPPPEPPPLPSGRVRLAELAGSMLTAAPLTALACAIAVPAYTGLNVELPQDPIQLAYLFTLTLLGTWGVLVPTKLWEGRNVPWPARRLLFLTIGLILGALGVGLAQWTRLFPSPIQQIRVPGELVSWTGPQYRAGLSELSFATYFALAFGLNGWWSMTARDRSSRFRFWPAIKAGAVAGLLGLAWPSPQPWAVIPIVIIAIVIQVVSPWSRAAADATAAAYRYRKQRVA
jgi:serine/threonine protein kinase